MARISWNSQHLKKIAIRWSWKYHCAIYQLLLHYPIRENYATFVNKRKTIIKIKILSLSGLIRTRWNISESRVHNHGWPDRAEKSRPRLFIEHYWKRHQKDLFWICSMQHWSVIRDCWTPSSWTGLNGPRTPFYTSQCLKFHRCSFWCRVRIKTGQSGVRTIKSALPW